MIGVAVIGLGKAFEPPGRQEVLVDDSGWGSGANVMASSREPLIGGFLSAVEQDRDPAVAGEDALETQRLIESILAKGGT